MLVRRNSWGSFTAVNARGAEITMGRAHEGAAFTPVELLMAAIAGCAGLSAERAADRRLGENAAMTVRVEATKDEEGNRLSSVRLSLELDPEALGRLDEDGRAELAAVLLRAVERGCTVSRSVEEGLPVSVTTDVPETAG
ncbi:MAG TPA: OsmC family protein [Pseudonocardiaceae bacterium]